MGIRGQLGLLVPGLVAVAVFGMAVAVTEIGRRDQLREFRAGHQTLLEAIGAAAAVHVAENDIAGLDVLIAHVSKATVDSDLRELAVLDHEGRIVAHSDPTHFNEVPDDPFIVEAVGREHPHAAHDAKELWIAVPAHSGLRWGTVVARYSLERLNASVARSRQGWFLGAAVLGLALYALLTIGLYRLVIRPVQLLQRTARRMGQGELEARVPPLRGRELGELGEAFNAMAQRLLEERQNLERTVAERTRELVAANVRLERLAVTDGLTGVFNHRRFQEALAQEVLRAARTQRPLSVLMVDVDHFKQFNDTFGHPAGDELLRRLAATLQNTLRTTDLLARYGGEEFGIILPETPKEVAMQVAERIRQEVSGGLGQNEWRSPVSVSVGVATWHGDGHGPQALVSAADRALYAAKHRGRNRVVAAGVEAA
jgi:diguanylate cyclase (GGDEF)-like protein